jgi:ZIP family zinc transporter
VLDAAFWGALSAGSLLIGAEIAFVLPMSRQVIGLIMAFGVGALFSAVSYELVEEALAHAEGWQVSLGLLVGAITFFVGDALVERSGGGNRLQGGTDDGQAKAIVLGSVLDGIPESVVLGLSLVLGGGVSAGLLAGIFLSNLPEGIGATKGLDDAGWTRKSIRLMWLLIIAVSTVAATAGYGLLESADESVGAVIQAFAAGALLTMIADTMAPEAYANSGKLSGLLTTLGFIVALTISTLG